jgi:hypothetical protein
MFSPPLEILLLFLLTSLIDFSILIDVLAISFDVGSRGVQIVKLIFFVLLAEHRDVRLYFVFVVVLHLLDLETCRLL